jgi:hypothetical protein
MSGAAGQVLERRVLNEEIEMAFVQGARMAGNVDMTLNLGKGNLFSEFQNFYQHFNYLVRLTIRLKEMNPTEDNPEFTKLKTDIETWLTKEIKPQDKIENHCKSGIKLFDKYYTELIHCGVISLPTRRGN